MYDSLNLIHYRVLDDILQFFASVLPSEKQWKLLRPSNLESQDDLSSCGAYVMYFSYAIAKTGAVPASSPSSKKIRNFVLKHLKGLCKISLDKSKCALCKKIVKEDFVTCNRCKSLVHTHCIANPLKKKSYVCH